MLTIGPHPRSCNDSSVQIMILPGHPLSEIGNRSKVSNHLAPLPKYCWITATPPLFIKLQNSLPSFCTRNSAKRDLLPEIVEKISPITVVYGLHQRHHHLMNTKPFVRRLNFTSWKLFNTSRQPASPSPRPIHLVECRLAGEAPPTTKPVRESGLFHF